MKPNSDAGRPGVVPFIRALVDISELDDKMQDQIAKYGSVKEFHVVLWRKEPDETGSNWDARLERMTADTLRNPTWWDVVPQLRARFNLT